MERILKKSSLATIISSILFAIIGFILIYNPNTIMSFVSYILGAAAILYGIVKEINYFAMKKKSDAYHFDLVFGIMAILAGIIAIVYSSTIASIFRICIGAWIIYSGLMRLQFCFKLKSISRNLWLAMLTIAILMILCGIYIALNSGILVFTIGILVVVYAIMDIIESIVFMRKIKEML